MAVRFVEGFEIDGGPGYYRAMYQNRPEVTADQDGRLFGTAIGGTTLVTPILSTSAIDEWIVGIGWYTGNNSDPDTDFIEFMNGGISQFSLHLRADRRLEVRRGSTVIETGTVVLPLQDWAYIEFKALMHTSAGSYEVRVDRITDMSGSSINSALGALNDADTVKFSSNGNNRFDDIYILDTATGVAVDFLGPKVVEGLLPTGDGDTQEWDESTGDTAYILVDDPAATLSVSDYIESATVGEDALFDFNNLSFISGEVSAVAVNAVVGLDGVGSRTFRVKYRSSADAEGNGLTLLVDSTQAQNRQGIMEQDPSGTPDAWALEDINNGQFGVEVVS